MRCDPIFNLYGQLVAFTARPEPNSDSAARSPAELRGVTPFHRAEPVVVSPPVDDDRRSFEVRA